MRVIPWLVLFEKVVLPVSCSRADILFNVLLVLCLLSSWPIEILQRREVADRQNSKDRGPGEAGLDCFHDRAACTCLN